MSSNKNIKWFYDTFTKRKKKSLKNLTPYLNSKGSIQYTSKAIKIFAPVNNYGEYVTTCESFLDDYLANDFFYDIEKNGFFLLGSTYNLKSKPKSQERIYSLKDYSRRLSNYTEKECKSLQFLSDYTFGFEFETSESSLKENLANDLGFARLYDGSIGGEEYVSTPMRYTNFHELFRFMRVLKSFTNHNSNCSLHIHVGNVPKNDEILLSIYSLFQRLQEDLNLIIAPYKKDFNFLANKGKDHCKNLPLIDNLSREKLLELFKLTDRKLSNYLDLVSKWNQLGRYYTVNFLNYICKNDSSSTIEFRSLQMTLNYDYLLTWLIINTSILDYAVKNPKVVLNKKVKIQIEDTLEAFIPDSAMLQKVLSNYYFIKNKIYNLKYIVEDKNTNSMSFDQNFNALTNLTGLSTNENLEKEVLKLCKVQHTDIFKIIEILPKNATKLTVPNQNINGTMSIYESLFFQITNLRNLAEPNIVFENIEIDYWPDVKLVIYNDILYLISIKDLIGSCSIDAVLDYHLNKSKKSFNIESIIDTLSNISLRYDGIQSGTVNISTEEEE